MLVAGSPVQAQNRLACCFADADCRYLSEDDCLSQGGAPQGPSSDCSDGTICCPRACCVPDEGCVELRLYDCIGRDGTLVVTDSDCNAFSCVPLQACCFDGGLCFEAHPGLCVTLLGTPQGAGSSCDSTECPPPQPGACCFPDGHCEEPLTFLNCHSLLGKFQGSNSRCQVTLCEIREACCLPEGRCTETTAGECTTLTGTPMGAGSDCDITTCPSPVVACCLPDDTCEEILASACADRSGASQGAGLRCAEIQCEREACCFGDDPCLGLSCVLLPPQACAAAGGQPLGAGYDCKQGCVGESASPRPTLFQSPDPTIDSTSVPPPQSECGCGTGMNGLMVLAVTLAWLGRLGLRTARSSPKRRIHGPRTQTSSISCRRQAPMCRRRAALHTELKSMINKKEVL